MGTPKEEQLAIENAQLLPEKNNNGAHKCTIL